ncbi:MAG: flagellar hook-length control protein FliK [Desulfovibrionaceae bacterium]|nr:flagellar hook-length control protein FliK [Desulfovibrionaceae bacterium]
MQNVPASSTNLYEKLAKLGPSIKLDRDALAGDFLEFMDFHASMFNGETTLAPAINPSPEAKAPTMPAAQAATPAPAATPAETKAEARSREGLQERKVSGQDIDDLEQGLRESGLSDKEIAELRRRAESDQGLTWGGLVAALNAKMSATAPAGFSSEQTEALTSFFSGLGFDQDRAADLVSDLSRGERQKVLEQVMDRLREMPQDQKLSLDKTGVRTFLSALNLKPEVSRKIAKLFDSEITAKSLRQALAEAQGGLAEEVAGEQRLVRVVEEALFRAAGDQNAEPGTKASKAAEGQVLGDKIVKAEVSGQGQAKAEDGENLFARSAQNQTGQDRTPGRGQGPLQGRAGDDALKAARDFSSLSGQSSDQAKDQDGQEAWQQFFAKVRVADRTGTGAAASRTIGTMAKNASAQTLAQGLGGTETQAGKTASAKTSAPRVLKQVQNGILRNLGQGRSQLTIQLKPENLGQVSVTLTVKNSEVKAVLKADSQETGKMLGEQLETIRQALEQQGLKVSKLEVQTELPGEQNARQWLGAREHNQAWEREFSGNSQPRWRVLRELNAPLVQALPDYVPEQVSGGGLHVIA